MGVGLAATPTPARHEPKGAIAMDRVPGNDSPSVYHPRSRNAARKHLGVPYRASVRVPSTRWCADPRAHHRLSRSGRTATRRTAIRHPLYARVNPHGPRALPYARSHQREGLHDDRLPIEKSALAAGRSGCRSRSGNPRCSRTRQGDRPLRGLPDPGPCPSANAAANRLVELGRPVVPPNPPRRKRGSGWRNWLTPHRQTAPLLTFAWRLRLDPPTAQAAS